LATGRESKAAFLTMPGNLDVVPIDLDAQSRDNLSTQVWPTPQRRSLVRTYVKTGICQN
jgi:hypothetical protein